MLFRSDECPSAPAAFSPFLCRGRKFLFFSFSCFSFGVWFVVFHLFFSISTLYVIHHHALLLYSILLEYTSENNITTPKGETSMKLVVVGNNFLDQDAMDVVGVPLT